VRIVVFHYHLLPGGVTDVIVNSIVAVIRNRSDVNDVTLVAGRSENADGVSTRLASSGIDARCDVLPELDYTNNQEPAQDAAGRAGFLATTLQTRYGGSDRLWWIHNYHLGKNPAFTLAICTIAAEDGTQPMLLHIHDFPEAARFENLRYLNRIAGPSPYPASPAVRYAVINERDREYLTDAGVRQDRVHLMVNPLPREPEHEPPGSRGHLVDALRRFAEHSGQTFRPDSPILLYPIRTIRRKNVLELGLLARLAGDWNLVTTLPGLSRAERPYSELVSGAYADGLITGVFGIGRKEAEFGTSFEELSTRADVIGSSSVQEGFGLLFINALRSRRPLFARSLTILDGIGHVFDGYPARFYACVRVPFMTPSLGDFRSRLSLLYHDRLNAIELPPGARARIDGDIEQMLGAPDVDFANLPVSLQCAVVRDAEGGDFLEGLRDLNDSTIGSLSGLLGSECPDISDRIERVFGFGRFAAGFSAAMDPVVGADRETRGRSMVRASPEGAAETEPAEGPRSGRFDTVQDHLVSAFSDLDHLRLIFAPMEDQT